VPNVATVQNYVFWEVTLHWQTFTVQRFGQPSTSVFQNKRMTLKLVAEDSFRRRYLATRRHGVTLQDTRAFSRNIACMQSLLYGKKTLRFE